MADAAAAADVVVGAAAADVVVDAAAVDDEEVAVADGDIAATVSLVVDIVALMTIVPSFDHFLNWMHDHDVLAVFRHLFV